MAVIELKAMLKNLKKCMKCKNKKEKKLYCKIGLKLQLINKTRDYINLINRIKYG